MYEAHKVWQEEKWNQQRVKLFLHIINIMQQKIDGSR